MQVALCNCMKGPHPCRRVLPAAAAPKYVAPTGGGAVPLAARVPGALQGRSGGVWPVHYQSARVSPDPGCTQQKNGFSTHPPDVLQPQAPACPRAPRRRVQARHAQPSGTRRSGWRSARPTPTHGHLPPGCSLLLLLLLLLRRLVRRLAGRESEPRAAACGVGGRAREGRGTWGGSGPASSPRERQRSGARPRNPPSLAARSGRRRCRPQRWRAGADRVDQLAYL
eukprot:scaffold3210_cov402-Prasinococcus_capsulatus_cf.AAC.17